MIHTILVLGGGSAGLLAALSLKRVMPWLAVRILRSPEIGVIGVGEGTTPFVRNYLFDFLRLDPNRFYAEAEPIWKLGGHFVWGPRPAFNYPFSSQFDIRERGLQRPNGYYAAESCDYVNIESALMSHDRAAIRQPDGQLLFSPTHAFHLENKKLIAYLERQCRELGVVIDDATVQGAERSGEGIAALLLESGERVAADLFIDASGFRSELIGRALGEPYVSYSGALFCDRAIIGGWPRNGEPIQCYTTAETMDAGWCWRIDHEHWINRGYVYSGAFVSDDAAREEFLRKNPCIAMEPRMVKFRSGRYARNWIGNVVGIGNATGFVEPLEATALTLLAQECRALIDALVETRLQPQPSVITMFNRLLAREWDGIRDFLAIHYRFNRRLDTPFWRMACEETPLCGAAALAEFYQECGPSLLARNTMPGSVVPYGLDGFLAILIGCNVPFRLRHEATAEERQIWQANRAHFAALARSAVAAPEALAAIRAPGWTWNLGKPAPAAPFGN